MKIVPSADLVYYFDTDIVITCAWSTLAGWARNGTVVVLDMADPISHRIMYIDGRGRGLQQKSIVNAVILPGTSMAAAWASTGSSRNSPKCGPLMEELESDGVDMRRAGTSDQNQKMKNWTERREFARKDQDVLNATIRATDTPIALLGAEAMGWFPGTGAIMPHAMMQKKPWVRNYIFDALRGFPPDRIYLTYWQFVEGPIRPFSEWDLKRKKTALTIARLIGFFHALVP